MVSIVTLPNFGEERAIADTLRLANLQVPVLVQATPDDAKKMTIAFRRDSFCGKMSACNNLKQYGVPYSITSLHTEATDSRRFAETGVVRRRVPRCERSEEPAHWLDRCTSHGFQHGSIQREAAGVAGRFGRTLDLSEVLGRIRADERQRRRCASKLAAIQQYVQTQRCAERGATEDGETPTVVEDWMRETELLSAQCSADVNRGEPRYRALYSHDVMSNHLLSVHAKIDVCVC